LCVPYIGGNEWKYVKEYLDAGWVSSAGAFVERFEREFAAAVGASSGPRAAWCGSIRAGRKSGC
jgi:perosamine synthetase